MFGFLSWRHVFAGHCFADILRVGLSRRWLPSPPISPSRSPPALVGSFGSGGHCRLRYRIASRISAHSFGVRPRRSAGRHGRHQYRRRPPLTRALRVAWIGAAIAAGLCELIGVCAALFPHAWLSLFGCDPAMIDAGSRYHARRWPRLRTFRARHGALLRFARRRPGSCGHCWPILPASYRGGRRLAGAAMDGQPHRSLYCALGRACYLRPDQCRGRCQRGLVCRPARDTGAVV